MKNTQKKVTEFQRKHKFPFNIPLNANRGLSYLAMWLIISQIIWLSKVALRYWKIRKGNEKHESFYRIHLILEELAEMMEGVNKGNLIKTADGLGDLLYVIIGIATCYHIPAHEVSVEVCRSNETKTARIKSNIRLRDKGKDWQPPNFEAALDHGRKRLDDEQLEYDLNQLTCLELRDVQNKLEDVEDKLKTSDGYRTPQNKDKELANADPWYTSDGNKSKDKDLTDELKGKNNTIPSTFS